MKIHCCGIGVGPGDPELLTLKAVRRLQELDVVVCPHAESSGRSIALHIARSYLPSRCRVVEARFPMTTDTGKRTDEIRRLVRTLLADRTGGSASYAGVPRSESKPEEKVWKMGFLTLGDSSIYSTFSYFSEVLIQEAKHWQEEEVSVTVETVAGIPSYHAIASVQSRPLLRGDESLTVLSASKLRMLSEKEAKKRLHRLLQESETVVIMKASGVLELVQEVVSEFPFELQATVAVNAFLGSSLVPDRTKESEYIGSLQAYANRGSSGERSGRSGYFTTVLIRRSSFERHD